MIAPDRERMIEDAQPCSRCSNMQTRYDALESFAMILVGIIAAEFFIIGYLVVTR